MLFKVMVLEKIHPERERSREKGRQEKSSWKGGRKPGGVPQESEEMHTRVCVCVCVFNVLVSFIVATYI